MSFQLKEYIDDTEDFINIQLVRVVSFLYVWFRESIKKRKKIAIKNDFSYLILL